MKYVNYRKLLNTHIPTGPAVELWLG